MRSFWISIIANCMSVMLGFSIVFGCWEIICDRFTILQIRLIVFFDVTRIKQNTSTINLVVNNSKSSDV